MLARRAIFVALATTPVEPRAAFFGLAPPPIERVVDYDELVDLARTRRVATVQIAPQHDQVVATTVEGRRVACALPDAQFPHLLADAMDSSGLPFRVVPQDEARAALRDVAKGVAAAAIALTAVDAKASLQRFRQLRRPNKKEED